MIYPQVLRQLIRVSLQPLTASRHPLYSAEAEEIIMMIAAHESHMGTYLRQIGGGPGSGLCQVEHRTMDDNFDNFLNARQNLVEQIGGVCGVKSPSLEHLICNHLYNIIMARIWLYRRPGSLPPAGDITAMAQYCRDHYNIAGGATAKEYEDDYRRLVLQT